MIAYGVPLYVDTRRADSDGDGVGDAEEVMLGLDPRDPSDGATASELLSNGGFEAEGGSLTGWLTLTQQFERVGSWAVQSGRRLPINDFVVPAPPEGRVAAVSESTGSGAYLLMQTFTLPQARALVLGFDLFIDSLRVFATPESFATPRVQVNDPPSVHNQQVHVDLMQPEAPEFALGDAVIARLFRTETGEPLISGYRRLLFDLTPYAGRTVRLRFSAIHNSGFLTVLVDHVRLLAVGER